MDGFRCLVCTHGGFCARGLKGIVSKRLRNPYLPGEQQWVKHKNRATARFAEERARSRRGAASSSR
jgi:ATP-dependent DNA ligase